MVAQRDVEYYHAVVQYVAQKLSQDEIIVQIREGQTNYGRQTFVIYRATVCTLAQLTGNEPKDKRFLDVQVSVDTRQASDAAGHWRPYDDQSVYAT